MKTVLFIPGFREDMESRNYRSTLAAIERKGYAVKFVPIRWARTTINDWVKELNAEYSKHDPAETILAGFSYGSMTAFMAAVNKNPSELWLFSFSPYFSDDMPGIKKSWLSNIGRHRADSFRKLDFSTLAKSITCKTLLMVGEIEAAKYPLLNKRTKQAHQKIANSNLIVVKGAGHDVADKNYIAAIKGAI
jgi:pimeloyl-ACP methyl ester carboxylesterase